MAPQGTRARFRSERISLPAPRYEGRISLEQALLRRRSVRDFTFLPLALAELSQLLWAAQGMTNPDGFRTVPSAGALYPLDVHVLAGNVTNLAPGHYHYLPYGHDLAGRGTDDKRLALSRAALDQPSVAEAAAVLILCAVYERTTVKYGQRGIRYVHMEAGHAAQNVYLQAVSLELGTVVIGAFDDEQVKEVLAMKDAHPLYLMPIGR